MPLDKNPFMESRRLGPLPWWPSNAGDRRRRLPKGSEPETVQLVVFEYWCPSHRIKIYLDCGDKQSWRNPIPHYWVSAHLSRLIIIALATSHRIHKTPAEAVQLQRLSQPFGRMKDSQTKFGARILLKVSGHYLRLQEFLGEDRSIAIWIPQGHYCLGWALFQDFFHRSIQISHKPDSPRSHRSKSNTQSSILGPPPNLNLRPTLIPREKVVPPGTSSKPETQALR